LRAAAKKAGAAIMVDAVWGRLRYGRAWRRHLSGDGFKQFSRAVAVLRWVAVAALLGLLTWGIAIETRTSFLQSVLLSRLTRHMSFSVAPGPSDTIVFPKYGPYDERLGYAEMPRFIGSLGDHHLTIAKQARWSPALEDFVKDSGYAIYHEKERAGLALFDRDGAPLYRASYPERTYEDFAAIPPVVVNSLSFIEDKDLFAPDQPDRNPAVDWQRFGLAVAGRVAGVVDRRLRAGGASTLATQLEKFRHSPEGRTPAAIEKLRQMIAASAHAYLDGRNTVAERRQIVAAYLNSEPLGSRPGYGEIIGVPEALWRWFGTDLADVDWVLTKPAATAAERARKGEIYRQVLGLLLAGRRPGYYLVSDHNALERLTDRYLHLLADAGVIDPPLRDAALKARLVFRDDVPPSAAQIYVGNKATDQLRDQLVTLLHLPDLYALDRLDVSGWSTFDTAAQERIGKVLSSLGDPGYDRSLGLYGEQLLGTASPSRLAWSVVLYERGANCNYVRVRADSLNEPFDINSGAKLQLGSTAKLRTLITYLDIVDALYTRIAALPRGRLLAIAATTKDDPITRWAAGWMADTRDRSLQAMLEAAMQRTYSASPGSYFTGGGMQSFANFAKWENHSTPTVALAFADSINNAFIRLMRDIVSYEIAQDGTQVSELLNDRDDPERMAYLRRFANQEGRVYLDRFWHDYRGRTPQEGLELLASRTRPDPKRLAVVFLSMHPNASRAALAAFLAEHLPHAAIGDDELWDLYRDSGPSRFSLRDRGYIAGVHPLELWLVGYLQEHPNATLAEVTAASAEARQEVYTWLFDSHSPFQQNMRIRILLEEDAFDKILQDWRRQGYPFGRLVPSDGTAIGSSGDRPDALADLMGIVVNDGVRLPTVSFERLQFAAGTPYETDMVAAPQPQRVLAPEVAHTVQRALSAVVSQGTAKAVSGVYRTPGGSLLPVGGKTGTGDNRYDRFGRGGRLISQRVVDRTATFVFYLGNRFYGTITAYVPGAAAAEYHFSSALAVHLLKALQPQLEPLLNSPVTGPAPALTQLPLPDVSDGISGSSVAPD
jgi:membrane peptidoglycan carboxypeptidase